jgi:kumamolisin
MPTKQPPEDQLTRSHVSRWRALAAAAAAVCALAGTIAVAGPARSAARPGSEAEPQAPAGSRALGRTQAPTKEHVSFILKVRGLRQLELSAESGRDHSYLSVRQFAASYGQPAAHVSALRAYLAKYGITSQAYADQLDVSATGTAAQFDAALGTAQENYFVPAVKTTGGQPGIAAQKIHALLRPAVLPPPIARFVLCMLGLNDYSPFTSGLVNPLEGVSPDVKFSPHDLRPPAAFSRDYGLDPLYARGYDGAGQTVGIIALASVNPGVPEFFWRKILHMKVPEHRITLVNVDGGAGPVSLRNSSDETTLDVEQSGGVALGAHIDVYQAPPSDFGFTDAFYTAASQDAAGSLSTSFALSETQHALQIATHQWPAAYTQALDQAFLEFAAQGQSMFAATGDNGAYAARGDIGTTNLSVQSPSSSPFVTAAGGTTLPGTVTFTARGTVTKVTVRTQRTWGFDYVWRLWKIFGAKSEAQWAEGRVLAGGGGGYSAIEPMPLYQQATSGTRQFRALQYLTPTKYKHAYGLVLPTAWKFDPAPHVTTGTGIGRAVPDLATSADALMGGYEIYDPQYRPKPIEGSGGTSFVAPQLNGAAAVINSYLGHRAGFWNPAIYRFASQPGSPFTPLGTTGTSNDNLYYTGTPGQVYNVGSGLGVPNLFRLAEDFARLS